MTSNNQLSDQLGTTFDEWEAAPTPKIPRRDLITSLIGLGPIPITKIIGTMTMVDEAGRLPQYDLIPPDGLTPGETVVRAGQMRRAMKYLDKVAKGPAEKLIRTIKSLMARINLLDDTIAQRRRDPMVGPNGEALTPAEAQDQHDTMRDIVAKETAAGSHRHLIRRKRSKFTEILLTVLDYPVFLMAMFAVFNVSLRLLFAGDGATMILAITAAVFALFGTFVFGLAMRAFGRRHRQYKNDQGSITASADVMKRIRVEQGAAIAIAALAASVMAARIWVEGTDAGAPPVLLITLAALFALLIGVSGFINYTSEYEDGSDTVDRVQQLSAQLLNRSATLDALSSQQMVLIEAAGIKIATLARLLTQSRERAARIVVTAKADKAITLARSYAGSMVPLPDPGATSDAFDLAVQQADELAAHHSVFAARTSGTKS